MILTNSEMQTFQRCRRKWWFGNYRQLTARQDYASYPAIGNLVHAGLAAYYDPADETDPVELVRDTLTATIEAHPDLEAQVTKDMQLAIIMLEGYFDWLAETGLDADLDVYASEEPLRVKLTDHHELMGKLDARARRRSDGARLFLEHKTVGNLTDLTKWAQLNQQFLSYHLLEYLQLLEGKRDERTDGVLLNMLRRVKRGVRAKPPFYARHEVRFNLEELRAHWRHVVTVANEIEATRQRLDNGESHHTAAPPVPKLDCSWSCQFFPVCALADDGSDLEGALEDLYETHDPLARYAEG